MKNTFTTPADFWQERDFGAKISAVFDFLGAHWRPLGKCLAYFVLPGALLMGVGLGLFTNSMYALAGHGAAQQAASVRRGVEGLPGLANFSGLGLALLGGLLAFLLLSGTLYGYVRARLHTPAEVPVTPAMVWAELRARLGRMVLAGLLLAVVGGVGTMLLAGGLLGGLAALLGGGGAFLGFLLVMVPLAYVSVTLSLFFPVLWLEDSDVMATLSRCFELIKSHWWATFGLLAVAGFLQSMLSIVFAIPQYVVLAGKMLELPGLGSDVLSLVAQCIYAIGIIFTYSVPLLALVFQYFNLAERKEGIGLHLLIDQLGRPQAAPVAQSSHYQPDEEGEY